MRLPRWVLGLAAAALWTTAAAPAEPVEAVVTSGTGVLTKCRGWFMSRSCDTYHHVPLPRRIELGENIPIIYGSNNRSYAFPVLGIAVDGESCTIFGETPRGQNNIDKLVVAPCRTARPTRQAAPH